MHLGRVREMGRIDRMQTETERRQRMKSINAAPATRHRLDALIAKLHHHADLATGGTQRSSLFREAANALAEIEILEFNLDEARTACVMAETAALNIKSATTLTRDQFSNDYSYWLATGRWSSDEETHNTPPVEPDA